MKARFVIGVVLFAAACGSSESAEPKLGEVTSNPQPRAGAIVVSPPEMWLNEGESGEFTFALTETPTGGAVTLTFANSDTSRLTIPPTISLSNTTPVTVTVNATDDALVNESPRVRVGVAVSGAGNYAGVSDTAIFVTTVDDEEPSTVVTPASLALTAGDSMDVTFALGAQPAGDVTVYVRAATQALVVEPLSLTFTTDDYATPQAVSVGVVDTEEPLDELSSYIVAEAHGSGYGGARFEPVAVTIGGTIPTTPSVAVTPTALELAENPPASGAVSVVLNVDPEETVTVTPAFDAARVTVTPAEIEFDSTNFQTAQEFTVTAVDNDDAEGDQATTIELSIAATTVYAGVALEDVVVTVVDDD